MKKIVVLVVACAYLAPASVAAADTPPGWISSPPAGSIGSQPVTQPSGIMLPTVLTLPRKQLMTYGGCVINVSWHRSSDRLFLSASPYGKCASRNIEKTLVWYLDVPLRGGYVGSEFGVGFNVMSTAGVYRARLSYSTAYGERQACVVMVASFSGVFTCR